MTKTRLFSIALVLAAAPPALPGQSLEAITRPLAGRSMRASSGNPFDNADSEKLAIGEGKTIAQLAGPGKIRVRFPEKQSVLVHGRPA